MLPIWKTRTTLRLGMSTKIRKDTTSALPEGYQPTDSHKANYLELYPEIKTLGKGYGYAKYASVVACTGCHEHENVAVPDGWLTYQQSQDLMAKSFGSK